jgi:hypothetical protein
MLENQDLGWINPDSPKKTRCRFKGLKRHLITMLTPKMVG